MSEEHEHRWVTGDDWCEGVVTIISYCLDCYEVCETQERWDTT